MTIALIDADSLVYACGFAAEHTTWLDVDGDYVKGEYEKKPAELRGLLYSRTEAEPIANCLHSVKLQLQSYLDAVGTGDYRVFLTGGGNFRERIATIRPYKGNRDPRHKPIHYQAIRDYLVQYWNAEVIHGMEADDAVACAAAEFYQPATTLARGEQRRDGAVVVSVDKDLLQIPGIHIVPGKGKSSVSEVAALRRLYWQAICGDSTDNVPGCYMAGPKKAKEIVMAAKPEHAALEAAAIAAYAASLKRYGAERCGYSDAVAAFNETYSLVRLVREWPVQHRGIYLP